jgi:predicted methyltransferase
MMSRTFAAAAAGLFLLTAGLVSPAAAQAPAPADALTDPALKRAEVLAFVGVRPGAKVADIFAGRFVRAFSAAVGPAGKVFAVMPAEIASAHPQAVAPLQALAADPAYSNVVLVTAPLAVLGLPPGLDAVFIRQNYHDLHDKFLGPADVPAFDRAVFAALKPGGVFVVLDHAAAAGSGLRDTDTLHRIDPAAVKAEVLAAGFVLDGESGVLANPADDHTLKVFDPAIRGHTDQFLLRFRKPR